MYWTLSMVFLFLFFFLSVVWRDNLDTLRMGPVSPKIFSLKAKSPLVPGCIVEGLWHLLLSMQVTTPLCQQRGDQRTGCAHSCCHQPQCTHGFRKVGYFIFFSHASCRWCKASRREEGDTKERDSVVAAACGEGCSSGGHAECNGKGWGGVC